MNRLKTVVKEHALNEEAMLTRIRSKQHIIHREEPFMSMKRLLPIGLAAALVLAVIASWSFFVPGVTAPVTTGTAAEKPAVTPYAMVAIDINPSFEVYTDEDGIVSNIIARNDDAAQFEDDEDFTDLIGEPLEKVTEKIIQWAKKKGFIVTSEANEAYVLISTVILDANKDNKTDSLEESEARSEQEKAEIEKVQDNFGQIINDAISGLDEEDLKVVVIKATLRNVKFAEKEKIPLGLYIVKGMVDLNGNGNLEDDDVNDDGEPDKISDIFKYLNEHWDDENLDDTVKEIFAKRISILERKADRDEIKESRKAENEADESEEPEDDTDSGKPESVPPVTPPGQAKKEPVASGS